MKQLYPLIIFIMGSFSAGAQQFGLKDLIDFTELSVNKFDAHVGKKDYKRDYYSPKESGSVYNYFETKKKKRENVARTIAFQSLEKRASVIYQTSSVEESNKLKAQIEAQGFRKGVSKSGDNTTGFYQKLDYVVNTSIEIKDTITFYSFQLVRNILPKSRDIVYAEDLLPLTSHEFLVHTFGEGAVKKDVFNYSETETNKCTVLFPNSNKQVIFIWKDENNYRNTEFLIIGGHLQTNSANAFNKQVQHNLWQSKQGIFSGMTLKELQELNEMPVNFYNWQMDQAGMLAPKNSGKIDFTKIGLVLDCLNCYHDTNIRNASITDSKAQLAKEKKVYVSSIIILPEKEKPATASR